MMEQCKKCDRPALTSEDFWPDKRYRSGHQPWCKFCCREYQLNRRERNRALERQSRYGISIDQQELIMEMQSGLCAACSQEIDWSAHLDHDHATGDIRGFLCPPCNLVLGHARENSARLRACVEYLDKQKYWRGET